MLKIFLTADNHLGRKYANYEQREVLARCRYDAFSQMVQAANEESCGLFVIAGDLFDNTYGIPRGEIRRLMDILSAFHGTVAILPGNHDHYDPDTKLWRYLLDLLPEFDNILLLTAERPYPLCIHGETVILYPAVCTSLHSAPGENRLGWIKEAEITADDTYHIGIAHGAVEGESLDREGRYFLMTRRELEQLPVDVWLLGHTHVPFPQNLTETYTVCERILNAGTHVQTDVACNTPGLCFMIEIEADKTIRAKKFVSGNMRFYRKTVMLTAGSMEQSLQEVLDTLEDNSVVDLIVTGAVSAGEYENRSAIIQAALARFLEGTCHDQGLSRLISKEWIEAEFPETSFSAGLLCALLDTPKEAQLVYEMLQTLKEGK